MIARPIAARRRAASFLARAIGGLCCLFAPPVFGGPVWVIHGDAQGQGFIFSLGRSCYAYTAGHVLAAGRALPVAMIDKDGFRVEGKVLKVDAQLDLGLIELPQGAAADRRLCSSAAATPMLALDPALEKLRAARPDIWLDRVASPAGGLDRFEMALARGAGDANFIDVVPSEARHATSRDRSPQKGDSGASVWISDRDTERRRYSSEGVPVERARGRLLGMLVSVRDNVSLVVRSDRIHEFIFNVLQPVAWNRVVIEPRHAAVVAYRRGTFARGPGNFDLSVSEAMLNHISFELDLGDRDTVVEGATIDLAAQPGTATAAGRRPQVRIHTSQFRPGDGAKWQADACAPERRNASAPIVRNATSHTCALRSPRVSRGVRIEIIGDPSSLRRISLLVGR